MNKRERERDDEMVGGEMIENNEKTNKRGCMKRRKEREREGEKKVTKKRNHHRRDVFTSHILKQLKNHIYKLIIRISLSHLKKNRNRKKKLKKSKRKWLELFSLLY